MFSGAETIAAIVRWFSVVGPRSAIFTRSEPAAASSKYFSIASAEARVPIGTHAKPEMRLGCRDAIRLLLSSRIDGEDDQDEREKDSPGAHARIIADGRSAASAGGRCVPALIATGGVAEELAA